MHQEGAASRHAKPAESDDELSFASWPGTVWEAEKHGFSSNTVEKLVSSRVQETLAYSELKPPTRPAEVSVAVPGTLPPAGDVMASGSTTTTTTTSTVMQKTSGTSPAVQQVASSTATTFTSVALKHRRLVVFASCLWSLRKNHLLYVETVEKALACLRMSSPDLGDFSYPSDAEKHFGRRGRAARPLGVGVSKRRKRQINETLSYFFPANFPAHVWAGYSGPWIENHWIRNFSQRWRDRPSGSKLRDIFGPFIPIFAPFVDMAVRSHGYPAGMMEMLKKMMRKDVLYVAVSQHDLGIFKSNRNSRVTQTELPNLLIFSAGGYGHVPIPLLKQPEQLLAERPFGSRSYFTSFVGTEKNGGVRTQMKKTTDAWAQQSGKDVLVSFKKVANWKDVLMNSSLALCPRGFGRSSFRTGELFQMGRVPIYIWDDEPWLFYKELWEKEVIGFSCNIKSLGSLLEHAASDMQKLEQMEQNILRMRESHFVYEGIIDQIFRFLTGQDGGSDLRCQKYPIRRLRRLRRLRLRRPVLGRLQRRARRAVYV
ncbi:unnamed protein product [Symbiodinium natans]|uniref:Exostosin GT47 domain-containing protein n=1 Tax=Symbiodinium natans TaxID=878477 RepID=A0A812JF30_9DINO|nr:unnamed protein product [Symbiodinium natans]